MTASSKKPIFIPEVADVEGDVNGCNERCASLVDKSSTGAKGMIRPGALGDKGGACFGKLNQVKLIIKKIR
jgi:hypothetical protein